MPKRRYQEGTFRKENGHFYSFFYVDRGLPDGGTESRFTRFDLGQVGKISELQARREHNRVRNEINRQRGCVPMAPKGETFKQMAERYITNIGPHLSVSTVRQRKSHLAAHLLPRFGTSALMVIDDQALQCFATELVDRVSRKTIVNILGTLLAVINHAKQCGVHVPDVSLKAIKLRNDRHASEPIYFKRKDVERILQDLREPYRTIFALVWSTGFRAGEVLGLRVQDVDFERQLIHPRKQADDRTRELRELKTPESVSPIPMTDATAEMLRVYLKNQWTENPQGLLFPNRCGRPRKRDQAVEFGLRPVLKRLGLPTKGFGFHAFRRGLGTALADNRVSPKVVQSILRHTDVRTTLRFYVHVDSDVQREALQSLQTQQSLRE